MVATKDDRSRCPTAMARAVSVNCNLLLQKRVIGKVENLAPANRKAALGSDRGGRGSRSSV